MNASPDVHGHEIGAENSHHIGDCPTPRCHRFFSSNPEKLVSIKQPIEHGPVKASASVLEAELASLHSKIESYILKVNLFATC